MMLGDGPMKFHYFYFYVTEVFHNNVKRIFSLVFKELGLELQIWDSSK